MNILIDCPKLVNCFFGANVINCIRLVHTSLVTYLEYSDLNVINFNFSDFYPANLVNLGLLARFTNVKILKYNSMLNISDTHFLTIISLPNLKEIYLSINGLTILNNQTLRSNDCNNLRVIFNYLKNQLIALGRLNNLKVYFQGIHIDANRSFGK